MSSRTNRDSPYGPIPLLAGTWTLMAQRVRYTPDGQVDIYNPESLVIENIQIQQNGFFFTYTTPESDVHKAGVFEPVFLETSSNGCFRQSFKGWKAHMVEPTETNGYFLFNFTKICKCGKIKSFELTFVKSGPVESPFPPGVDRGIGCRV